MQRRSLILILALLGFAAAQKPLCTVSPITLSFEHYGGAHDVTVTGDRVWVPAPVPDWIAIVGMSNKGDGPGMFTVGVGPNTGPARKGIIRVGGAVVTVTQKKGR